MRDGEVLRQPGRATTTFTRAADAVAVRSACRPSGCASQLLPVAAVVAQHDRLLADVADDDVDVAVVVEIAECGAAAGPVLLEDLARR